MRVATLCGANDASPAFWHRLSLRRSGIAMLLKIATAAIFLLTYGGVAIGRFPGLRIDRAGIALTGAAFTIAVGAISPEEAYRAIDLDTDRKSVV